MRGGDAAGAKFRLSWAVRALVGVFALLALLPVVLYAAYLLSPWPSALFYRVLMDRGGVAMANALAKHVPPEVRSLRDLRYDPADPDALLDVHYPSAVLKDGKALPTVVWIHGGGFISGGKEQIANYARIVAAGGYTVVGVNYSLAPGARYPTPLRQVDAALGFLLANAARLHVDPDRIVLAGDSAGAQVAAQMAAIVSAPDYAKAVGIAPRLSRLQLAGVVLFCGVYDARLMRPEGPFAGFLQAVGWSYFGTKDFSRSPGLAQFSVVDHVTSDYPPSFVSAGNRDPLLAHSLAMVQALTAKGVAVETLFFPEDYSPPLGHEYQFDLDSDAGKQALSRLLAFLQSRPR
jgi:acetyl esterase